MLRQHYKITTDVARVYKVRTRARGPWASSWTVATIREWPRGGQLDVQSDLGNYAYAWSAIGQGTLRGFLQDLEFDYFMNKACARDKWREFDEEASVRAIKTEIFRMLRDGEIERKDAHEWRDELDEIAGEGSEHVFAERFMQLGWWHKVCDNYPGLIYRDSYVARAFWDGPWQALCAHWRKELQTDAAYDSPMSLTGGA